jgi:hypothetical protein
MAQPDEKVVTPYVPPEEHKVTAYVPIGEYSVLKGLADELLYAEGRLAEILICFALPNWEAAVAQWNQRVKQRRE